MKVLIVGGGPGGLYLALLLKRDHPSFDVSVLERDRRGVTFGWGVVFSEDAVKFLCESDAQSGQLLSESFSRWQELEVRNRGETVVCSGHHFAATGRPALLRVLQTRCEELGVQLRFESAVHDRAQIAGYDLVVAADGVRSTVRDLIPGAFSPTITPSRNRYVWFGTRQRFERFTTSFRETEHGIFWVYAYPFDHETATFNIECNESTFHRSGMDRASEAESIAYCERAFAGDLGGHRLLANRSNWSHFNHVTNPHWSFGNIALLGDAAHTAHFTVGSGTKLAMEDAVALARSLESHDRLGDALTAYERSRRDRVGRLQAAAQSSTQWFDHVSRYIGFEPLQLAASLFTRSGRVSYANLQLRDPEFGRRVEARLGAAPIRSALRLRGMELGGRVILRAPSPRSLDEAAAVWVELDELADWRRTLDGLPRQPKLLVQVGPGTDLVALRGVDGVALDAADWPAGALRSAREALAVPIFCRLGADASVSDARALKEAGCDVLITRTLESADCFRNEVSIPVMIQADAASAEEIDTAVVAGRADLYAVSELSSREEQR
jgi:anthraniloyl-CoA monooxygenase